MREKIKQTNLEKYNVENPFQAEEIKNKIKKTKFERYGDETFVNGDKISQTLQSRTIEQKQESLEKLQKTSYKKYGVAFPNQNEEIKQKIRDTMQEHFDAPHYMQSNKGKQIIRNKNFEKYGVDWNLGRKDIHNDAINTIKNNRNLDNELENPDE